MNSQESFKTKLLPGHIWHNIAPLGSPPDWVMEKGILESMDHAPRLFGFPEE